MFGELKVFVKVIEESDNPSTIRFLQGISSPDFIVFYEVNHYGSPLVGLTHDAGLLKRTSSFGEVLAS